MQTKNGYTSIYSERITEGYGSLKHVDPDGDVTWSRDYGGLTKREHFSIIALQGILSNHEYAKTLSPNNDWDEYRERSVKSAIDMADELLKQLEK